MKIAKRYFALAITCIVMGAGNIYAEPINVTTTDNTEVAITEIQNKADIELNENLAEFLVNAREVRNETLDDDDRTAQSNEVFQYLYCDEETGTKYVYENAGGKESIATKKLSDNEIAQLNAVTTQEDSDDEDDREAYVKNTNLPGGIGGRVRIPSKGSRISGTFVLPAQGTVKRVKTGSLFIYSGVYSNTAADMGLTWKGNLGTSGNEEGWVPAFLIDKKMISENVSDTSKPIYYKSGYDQVVYRNGYKPGTSVTFNVYPNYQKTNKFRLELAGTAIHSNRKGEGGNTYLRTILEYSKASSVVDYKILATSTSSDSNQFVARIKDVKIDGVTPTNFAEAEADNTKIIYNSRGDYTFKVGYKN